jgi:hypothetical protein
MSEQKTGLGLLREPFPPHQISYLPKGGIKLAYVGHAALTDRLLDADPTWQWEPLAMSPDGLPMLDPLGGMWIKLTVCGVTRLGYGHAGNKEGGDAIKEVIGDALRNAAMRFGAALDLWHKGELHKDDDAQHASTSDPLGMFPAPVQAKIRKTAIATIAAFNEGSEWGAYEEASSLWNQYPEGDERNQIKLALAHIFKPHPALRASLKKSADMERVKETT